MLSAIIVSYKTLAELAATLASLRAQTRPPDEIIVVENAFAEEDAAALLSELDGARLERPPKNVGSGLAQHWGEVGAGRGPAAEELVGHEFADEDDRLMAVREMVELGAQEALMTLPDGCLALLGADGDPEHPRRPLRAPLDPLEPVSAVGSGDAFLGGFVAARDGDRSPEDCLRFGVACGAESTRQHFGAGVIDLREVERLVTEVRGETLEAPAVEVS